MLVVQVIKRHAQSTLKSRKEHKNVLQLYKIIMKNNTYGGLHLIIIKWSLSYLVISKSFQRKKNYFFLDFLYILHEWKKYTGELSVAITFQIFLSNNIPFEVLGLHGRQGQQCGSGKGGTPSRLERGAILWHHAACVEAE